MQNDSIETLLLRHYGSAAPAPAHLEDMLLASVRQEAATVRVQKQIATTLRERPMSRRRVVKMVAIGTAGLGALSVSLGAFGTALTGQETGSSQPAYS